MKFTFGIITSPGSRTYLEQVLYSIERENILDENYEVIIVGGDENYTSDLVKLVAFDESKKKAWITRKKNIITEMAKYENIVYMHDYVSLVPGWYKGFQSFGNNFDLCMTPIKNVNGSRFRDWTLWPDDLTHILGSWNSRYLLPYDVTNLSKYMYFSGAYWIAKKSVMQRFPLDEILSWGESEDVKWSKQVREHYEFSINTRSEAILLKQKDRVFNEITPEMLKTLNDYDARVYSS